MCQKRMQQCTIMMQKGFGAFRNISLPNNDIESKAVILLCAYAQEIEIESYI